MFINKLALSRRTVLRGMGAAVALPFLEAMVPAFTATAKTAANPVRRFGAVYLPHGFIMDKWTPSVTGTGIDFQPVNQSLEAYRDHVVLTSGLDAPGPSSGLHAIAPTTYLSGVHIKRTEGSDVYAETTLDQILAKKIGQETQFPSLEIATEDFSGAVGACDTGYSCVYINTLSWASPTTPLPMETNPRVLFERMFGGTGTTEERLARRAEDKSILDAIRTQASTLQTGLGARDRVRLSDYLDNVREIERRIQLAENTNSQRVEAPDAPLSAPPDFGDHANLIYDMITVALQADMTRIFTYMMARDLHARTYLDIGADESHHRLSHHGNNPVKMTKFQAVNTFHHQLFAKFLGRLQAIQDGDGTLLDHSLIMFGSGMSTGNVHSHVSLPLIIAGNAGGTKGNRHLVHPKETPTGNLLVAMGARMGVELPKGYGRSTGSVDL